MVQVTTDRVQETTATSGTSAITLAGAVAGFVAFSSVMNVGDTCYYAIVDAIAPAWETGIGTYSAASTLTRTTINTSSNANSVVSLAGNATTSVFITLTSTQYKTLAPLASPAFTGTATISGAANVLNLIGSATTVPLQIKATGTDTNIGIVIQPKGNGAFIMGAPPDNTAVGGNARGTNAIDMQTLRSAATQVASGASSIAIGNTCTASVSSAVAIGAGCYATGVGAVAIGSNTQSQGANSLGLIGATASGDHAVAIGSGPSGQGSLASGANSFVVGAGANDFGVVGKNAYAAGDFAAVGDAQSSLMVLRGSTATSSVRLLSGVTLITASTINTANIQANTSHNIQIAIQGRENGYAGNRFTWFMPFAELSRDTTVASTTYTAGATAQTLSVGTGSTASVSVTADTTNAGLNITVTSPTPSSQCSFTGTVPLNGSTLSVTAVTSGTIAIGQALNYSGINPSYIPVVTAFNTGTGGVGTYTTTFNAVAFTGSITSSTAWHWVARIRTTEVL